MQEIWKDIKGYEGKYQVSNLGRVKSFMLKKEFIRKLSLDSRGYYQVKFFDDKMYLVHHLVINHFKSERKDKQHQCNHIDGNKLNNNIENLEWVTRSENMLHAYRLGLNYTKGKKGESHPLSKINEQDVLDIRSSKLTNKQLSKKYNINIGTIYKIKLKQRWKHI